MKINGLLDEIELEIHEMKIIENDHDAYEKYYYDRFVQKVDEDTWTKVIDSHKEIQKELYRAQRFVCHAHCGAGALTGGHVDACARMRRVLYDE